MVYQNLVSSIIVTGEIHTVFDGIKKELGELGFKESASIPPKQLELMRGKGGLLTTKIKDCKTILKVSLKAAPRSNRVHILFDYTFDVPGLFTARDKDFIMGELSKIHHSLFDTSKPSLPEFLRSLKSR